MGFSTIGSFIIMFFGIMILISSSIFIYNSLVENTNAAANIQKERIDNRLNTRVEINSIQSDDLFEPDRTIIYIINTGSKKLETDYIDVFIDDIKIPRSNANRTIWFANDSNIANPLHWDPDEILGINVSLNLKPGTHIAAVSTEYGVTDSKGFIS
jgi:archaellum component FlaF (FlaF/FlaG flagellin family)